jgi:DNA-binding NtrC family response regulator
VRVIAATNADLAQAVRDGRFRDDLYYRLNVISIHIPPLRERREDIPLLTHSFIGRLAHEIGKDVSGISDGALRVLVNNDWPGNVRELENAIERAMVTCKTTTLTEEDFSFLLTSTAAGKKGWSMPVDMTLEEAENQMISATLQRVGGNIKEAATILGIDRSTLYDKIKKFNLPRT